MGVIDHHGCAGAAVLAARQPENVYAGAAVNHHPTLRGALVRDPRIWARYLTGAILLFGDRADFARCADPLGRPRAAAPISRLP